MMRPTIGLLCLTLMVLTLPGITHGQPDKSQEITPRSENIKPFHLNLIGTVKHRGKQIYLEILPQYAPALDGLSGFSHVWVFYWFHETDTPEDRATLKVHPRRDPANPLTGVFATRAPVRPNLIGLTACRIVKISGNTVEVEGLDAKDGSPIVDLKPYIPKGDSIPGAVTPDWVKKPRPESK
ncbi:MAG: tRNA (N6-threonylcarbamoyladenosine(37)-N6)-methyltransferase TrmO [Thermodesulfobacteriota bacterium]